jgi:hypothetical protein
MRMEHGMTRGQLVASFKEACQHSAAAGAAFIDAYIFGSGHAGESVNQEVDRKFERLSEFAATVVGSFGIGGTFQNLRPRDYMDQLMEIEDPGSKQLQSRIYGVFYTAGHHIRALTDREDYIVPPSATRPTVQSPGAAVR